MIESILRKPVGHVECHTCGEKTEFTRKELLASIVACEGCHRTIAIRQDVYTEEVIETFAEHATASHELITSLTSALKSIANELVLNDRSDENLQYAAREALEELENDS